MISSSTPEDDCSSAANAGLEPVSNTTANALPLSAAQAAIASWRRTASSHFHDDVSIYSPPGSREPEPLPRKERFKSRQYLSCSRRPQHDAPMQQRPISLLAKNRLAAKRKSGHCAYLAEIS